MVPEDRVGADAALAVVDDRALVVGAQQHQPAVELEQVALGERGGDGVAVENTAELELTCAIAGATCAAPARRYTRTATASRSASNTAVSTSPRSSPSACSGSGRSQRTSIRSRSWPGARRPPAPAVAADDVATGAAPTGAHARAARRSRGRARSAPRGAIRSGSGPGIGVRIAVRDEDERGAAVPDDLERGIPAAPPLGDHLPHRPRTQVARARAGCVTTELVEAPHRLAVEADAGREAEATAVHRAERDPPGPPLCDRRRDHAGRVAGSRGNPSARGKTLVPPPGRKPSGERRRRRSAPRCRCRRRQRRRSHRRVRPPQRQAPSHGPARG